MSFSDRIHHGIAHERACLERLENEGWTVQPWGQGILTDEIRNSLRDAHGTIMWRWTPDLIAVRNNEIRLVDPKSDIRADTEFFSLEVAAWATHTFMRVLGLPVIYVWQDFSVNWPDGIEVVRFSEGTGTRGSGTPFVLIRKTDQHPWESAFPVR